MTAGTTGTTGEATWSTWHTTTHSTGHTARHTTTLTTSTVELHHDGVGNTLKLLLLSLVFFLGGGLVVVEPGNSLVNIRLQLLLVGGVELLVNLGV